MRRCPEPASGRDLDELVPGRGQQSETPCILTHRHVRHLRRCDRAWLDKTVGESTYTTTLTGQRQDGPDRWTVIAHLEGDFPGGVVDLPFRSTLRGDKISKLLIAF